MVSARGGFSLPEALIALTISSMLVMLVGAVFLAQNDFYAHVLLRSQVHENARAMTQLVASEVSSIGDGAIILADSSRLVVRQPIATFAVCGGAGNPDVFTHVPGGTGSFDTDEVAGIGRVTTNGVWTWHDIAWRTLLAPGGSPTRDCYNNGADTAGVADEFYRFNNVNRLTGMTAVDLLGSTFVIYGKTEFRFDNSTLVAGTRALYRGKYGGTLAELATGLTSSARFEYWTGSSWSKSVSTAALPDITRIRLVAQSQGVGETSRQAGYDFGWTVDIPVANAL